MGCYIEDVDEFFCIDQRGSSIAPSPPCPFFFRGRDTQKSRASLRPPAADCPTKSLATRILPFPMRSTKHARETRAIFSRESPSSISTYFYFHEQVTFPSRKLIEIIHLYQQYDRIRMIFSGGNIIKWKGGQLILFYSVGPWSSSSAPHPSYPTSFYVFFSPFFRHAGAKRNVEGQDVHGDAPGLQPHFGRPHMGTAEVSIASEFLSLSHCCAPCSLALTTRPPLFLPRFADGFQCPLLCPFPPFQKKEERERRAWKTRKEKEGEAAVRRISLIS